MILKLIKAIDPADLTAQVKSNLVEGFDMHTPLFADDDGMLCQFVMRRPCLYEYTLIIASDLDELEDKVTQLSELKYDFIFNTVMWRGWYLQWMCRLNNTGMKLRDAVSIVHDEYIPAERRDELNLVADVQAGLQLEPISAQHTLVTIPFPLLVS